MEGDWEMGMNSHIFNIVFYWYEHVFHWVNDICVLEENVLSCWSGLQNVQRISGTPFWLTFMPRCKRIAMKGVEGSSIILVLAHTSWQDPRIYFSGIMQTSPHNIRSMKMARLGIFTPWELANATNQRTASSLLPKKADSSTFLSTPVAVPEPFGGLPAASSPQSTAGLTAGCPGMCLPLEYCKVLLALFSLCPVSHSRRLCLCQ